MPPSATSRFAVNASPGDHYAGNPEPEGVEALGHRSIQRWRARARMSPKSNFTFGSGLMTPH